MRDEMLLSFKYLGVIEDCFLMRFYFFFTLEIEYIEENRPENTTFTEYLFPKKIFDEIYGCLVCAAILKSWWLEFRAVEKTGVKRYVYLHKNEYPH